MIPNVVKGAHMAGLLYYLVGEGRANEHENPHVIGGDDFVQAWHGAETLNARAAGEIAAYLDEPRKLYDVQMGAQETRQDPETGERVVVGHQKQDVWHCSLSLAPEEGPLSDEAWQSVAQDFMDRMGFTETGAGEGKAPARWVAIHHGASKGGNDHIHIAASMVREDGTRWDGRYKDFQRAQEAARAIELTHGLVPVDGPAYGTAGRGEKRGERTTAAKAAVPTTVPKELGARVRAATVASTSEAEWIRRMRADGVVVKPYYAKGSTDVVTGYRAALKPADRKDKPVFYGGGRLGKDLTLPRLREAWGAPSLADAEAASGEWRAAFQGRPVVGGQGRETVPLERLAPGAQDVAAANYAAFNAGLAAVPIGDRASWADAARDASGVLSAWARLDQVNAEELRGAASAMSRSAQLARSPYPPGRRVKESAMGTALILTAAAKSDRPRISTMVLMRQVLKTAEALRDHHRVTANLRQAHLLQVQVVDRLQRIQLVEYPTGHLADRSAAQARAAGDIAAQLTPSTGPARTSRPGAGPLPRPLATPKSAPQIGAKTGRPREDPDRGR